MCSQVVLNIRNLPPKESRKYFRNILSQYLRNNSPLSLQYLSKKSNYYTHFHHPHIVCNISILHPDSVPNQGNELFTNLRFTFLLLHDIFVYTFSNELYKLFSSNFPTHNLQPHYHLL